MELPSWLNFHNVSRGIVLILAMFMHYHFIMSRIIAANEEAIKVLKDMPDTTPGEQNS